MSQQADPEGERLATQEHLGMLQQIYKPGWFFLVLGIVLTLFLLAMLPVLLSVFNSIPGWDSPLAIVLWLLLLILLIAITLNHSRERSRRILLYEQGLIDMTPSGTQVIRWDQVQYIWQRAAVHAGPSNPVTFTPYRIQTINGVSLSFDASIARQDALIKNLDRHLIPSLLSQARERYQTGQEVDFDSLVLSKAGLRTKDGKKTLSWSEVASVKEADTLKIKQQGKKLSWFDRAIPNRKVCETLLNEILAEQSAMAPLEE